MNAAAGLTPRSCGDRGQRRVGRAVVARRAVGRQHVELGEVDLGAVDVGVGDQALPERGVADQLHLATVGGGAQFLPDRDPVERCPALEPEQDPDAPRRRLRPDARTRCVLVAAELDDPAIQIGAAVAVGQAEADRAAAAPAGLAHPRDLGSRVAELLVVTFAEAHRAFEDARAGAAEHVGERQQLVGGRVRAGHRAAVGHAVQERAAGREAERARRHRFFEERRHRVDVVGPRRLGAEPALAHHVRAQRAVADEPAGVGALRHPVERGVELAVRLPVPRQAVEDRVAGDVLDALHHLREVGPIIRPARRERDTAVAEDDARDAVPAAGRGDRVPRQLGVEVRVDVDEAGRDDRTRGVDVAPAGFTDRRFDGGDAIADDPDITVIGGRPGAVDDHTPANHDVVAHSRPLQTGACRRLSGRMTQLFDHATVGAATVRATCVTGLELDCNKQSLARSA